MLNCWFKWREGRHFDCALCR